MHTYLKSLVSLKNALIALAFALIGCQSSGRDQDLFTEISVSRLTAETAIDTIERVRIFNFWASWCTPCIKEMPEFDAFAKRHSQEVDLYFVNLDREEVWETAVVEAVKNLEITHPIWLVQQTPDFDWRMEIADQWVLPAIPVTLLTYKDRRIFFMGATREEDLEAALLELHNN
jgi:thiol-disulfide isomerase/thioredoxin